MSLASVTQGTHTSAANSSNRSSQVLVLLTPTERADLERVAENEQRSLSATARIMICRGVSQYDADTLVAE